jgi:hypothetical protein
MLGSLLIIAITLYITSMAFALILSITGRNKNSAKWKTILIIHLTFFACFLIFKLLSGEKPIAGLTFLLFFCSGIIGSGYTIRSKAPTLLRIYFALYIASIFIFLTSPSSLIKIITMKVDKSNRKEQFHLSSNYYLEEEQMLMGVSDSLVKYKITQHFGVFHKTLTRDLRFGYRLDSIRILSFNPATGALLRGYSSSKSITFEVPDSVDLKAVFNSPAKEQIQRKINNK